MAKKLVDTQDIAVRVKRGQIGLKDVPTELKGDVLKHLSGAGEARLVQRMRQDAPASERASQRVRQRFVAG